MKIDTHVHIGSFLQYEMTEEQVINSMTKYGIDYSIVSCMALEYGHTQDKLLEKGLYLSQKEALQRGLNFAKKYKEKIGIAAWIRPLQEKCDNEFVKLIEDNIEYIKAIKLHSYHSKISANDDRLKPYYALAEKFNLPIVIHTGGCKEAMSIEVYKAAKNNPKLRFIMVHMDLGTDHRTAIKYIKELPNLYGDTTWVSMEDYLFAINECGINKILFGSDSPIDGEDTYFCNKKGDRSIYQDYFNVLPKLISKKDYEALMSSNAKRVFNL